MKKRALLLIILTLMLQGCALGISEYTAPELPLPASYLGQDTSELWDNKDWWQSFGSAELNALEEKALASFFYEDKKTGSFDLQIAWSKLQQSEAGIKRSNGNLFPSVDYRLNESRNRSTSQKTEESEQTTQYSGSYSGSLSLSYEIDLWGKVAAQNQADKLRYTATYEDMLTTVQTVASSVANSYIDILATRAEIAILEKQVALTTTMLEMQQTRYTFGQATGLDILQQQEQLIRTASEKPTLLERERALLASLSILLGELPSYEVKIEADSLPQLPVLPEVGIPVQLLENRPDIRAAALRLKAYDKELAIAKLGYLPNFTLSANSSVSSGIFDLLFNNWVNSLTGAIAGTLFDGGKKKSDEERSRAIAEEYVIRYTQVVATALNEVDTALMAEAAKQAYIQNLEKQLEYAKAAEQEAQSRYLYGKDTFLRYITQVQSVQSLERTLIREQANLLKLRISLYKALGIRYEKNS